MTFTYTLRTFTLYFAAGPPEGMPSARKSLSMEKIITLLKCIYTVAFLLVFSTAAMASDNVKPVSLGTVKQFIAGFSGIRHPAQTGYTLRLKNNRVVALSVEINNCTKNDCYVFGTVQGYEQATFFIRGNAKNLNGKVIFRQTKEAYDIFTGAAGEVLIAAVDIDKVICVDYDRYEGEGEENSGNPSGKNEQSTMVVPLLNSLPGAYGTIYLDFDGENVTGSSWGNINAPAPGFTTANITTIWTAVSEDYSPFNVNITTDVAVYNAAAANKRMQVIFTPNDQAAPGAGGVAYLGSFGSGEPCWVFNSGVKDALEAASHETGHTMGLSHDGRTSPQEEYFAGQGSWGPIMGAVYSRAIVQWSKGEYTAANNTQNDLTIISNKIPYRLDDAGNNTAGAKALVIGASGTVTSTSNFGVIERTTDLDVYTFTTTGGTVTFSIKAKTEPGSVSVPDLDIQARLLNSSGTEIVKANPTSTLSTVVAISQSLTAGTYYLEIDGVGALLPATTGYSDYGSLGQYFISGNIPGGTTGAGINDGMRNHAISVFPNPSSGVFTIDVPLEGNNESSLQVLNSLGQPVLVSAEKTSGTIRKQIDLSGYASGIYCVMLTSGNDVWKGKVILK